MKRLESVEVQMALAGLDQANSLIADEEPEIVPISLSPGSKRKRERSSRALQIEQENAQNSGARNAPEKSRSSKVLLAPVV